MTQPMTRLDVGSQMPAAAPMSSADPTDEPPERCFEHAPILSAGTLPSRTSLPVRERANRSRGRTRPSD